MIKTDTLDVIETGSAMGTFSVSHRNSEEDRVIMYCLLNGLSIMNTFLKHRESHKRTYYGGSCEIQKYKSKSMIHFFLTPGTKIFRTVRAVPSLSIYSTQRIATNDVLRIEKEKLSKKRGK